MNTFLFYLLESSVYLLVLALVYRWLLAHQTHFLWMRVYLLLAVGSSLVFPLLPTSISWFNELLGLKAGGQTLASPLFSGEWFAISLPTDSHLSSGETKSFVSISLILTLVYSVGSIGKLLIFGINLHKIWKLISYSSLQKEGSCWVVSLPNKGPTFSFLNYVFINQQESLSPIERQQVLKHELLHIRQLHTLDLLFLELARCILWFHPMLPYLKRQLREVQEYLADQAVTEKLEDRRSYAHLLLRLATETHPISLVTSFSGKQVGRRIAMLTKPRSKPQKRWYFASIVPLCTMMFLLNACLDESSNEENNTLTPSAQSVAISESSQIIGKIRWEGNTIYDDATLTKALGLQSGSPYDSITLAQQLSYNSDGSDVSSLYMDNGYLYLNVDVQKVESGEGKIDLLFSVHEGDQATVSEIILRGNQEIPKETILKEIAIEPGELFSRSKLVEAHRAVAGMGYFDSEQVIINPIPGPENRVVALEFVLKRTDVR